MARPGGPLLEFSEDWTPIFADPRRDYDCLSQITSCRPSQGGAELEARSESGETARLRIAFVTPAVVRVQAWLDVEPPADSPMLVAGADTPKRVPRVRLREDDAGATVESRALRVRVSRRPWSLSIADGRGRVLHTLRPDDRQLLGPTVLPTGYSRDRRGRVAFHQSFSLEPDERLYGLGEQFGPFDKRGQRLVSWSRDPLGSVTSTVSYLNVPFLLSSRGYGLFVHHHSKIVYELGQPSPQAAAFRVDDPYLDYFFIHGPSPKAIIGRYGRLTGRPVVPPLWSFGVWFSRCMYSDREQVEGIVERLRGLGIPGDVVHLDPRWLKERRSRQRDGCDFVWDEDAFPDPEGFVRWLAERGFKLSLWENPYVWKGTPMYREAVPPEALFADGRSGEQLHNLYPLLYNRAVFETIREERGEAIVFGRSGYAGSQRYPINWTGDAPCTWGGLAATLRAGLSLSLSGISMWSHDIGGFWNPDNLNLPDPTLYVRWAQFGLLSSHARFHGIRGREPWYYGDEAVAIVRRFARLRYRLLPYIYSLAREAAATGLPVVRPLLLEYPDDPAAAGVDFEYLLGPDLLVAPVLNAEGRALVYLPRKGWEEWWIDWWTGTWLEGGGWYDIRVPLGRVPLYVRHDSILPLAPEMEYVGQRPWEPITLDVRLGHSARTVFWDPSQRVEAAAERRGNALRLRLSPSRHRYEVRFLEPYSLEGVEVNGAGGVSVRQTRRATVVRFRAQGECELTARVLE